MWIDKINRISLYWTAVIVLGMLAVGARAGTVAYWRFEEGSAGGNVVKPFGALDSSGNGNRLDPGTQGGDQGFWYRPQTAYTPVPATAAVNALSVKNTGSAPSLETRSQTSTQGTGSYPTGIDIETITPAQFTIEAFFKPENGGYRTLVGRDASGVVSTDLNLAALYFQIRPDQSVAIVFADVSGYLHTAASPAGMIQGFDWSTDPDGTTGRWYYMAAVSNGSTLSLYLANVSAGTAPFLVAQTDMTLSGSPNRALAKGSTSGSGWHTGAWSVGRGMYGGSRGDRAYGYIDEVRISDSALSVGQFLMMPKPTISRNPLFDAGDPFIMVVDQTAWIYPTAGYYRHFYAYSSTNLVNWQTYGPILNFDTIGWIPAGKCAWAPCMIRKNGRYYFYYSVGPKPSYIGVASGLSPTGPFTDKGSALLADNNASDFEAIDPMVFTDPATGVSYLYALPKACLCIIATASITCPTAAEAGITIRIASITAHPLRRTGRGPIAARSCRAKGGLKGRGIIPSGTMPPWMNGSSFIIAGTIALTAAPTAGRVRLRLKGLPTRMMPSKQSCRPIRVWGLSGWEHGCGRTLITIMRSTCRTC
jgi:hypothetical protein